MSCRSERFWEWPHWPRRLRGSDSWARSRSELDQPEADRQCFIDLPHGGGINHAEALDKALSVNRSDLIENDGRGLRESTLSPDNDFPRMRRVAKLRTDGSHN